MVPRMLSVNVCDWLCVCVCCVCAVSCVVSVRVLWLCCGVCVVCVYVSACINASVFVRMCGDRYVVVQFLSQFSDQNGSNTMQGPYCESQRVAFLLWQCARTPYYLLPDFGKPQFIL